ncbi:LysR substrate-binding domain-containing protein [Microvirga alba]|uniref:LysR family transcriptional regulator n=1 Tax=Microvirga alba TaxID=2791025 RepID=A0A931BMJ2_9HYPH|nr:LysR substrate-binding domain-containing protein [Microvirga alba]MBF9233847.1 LysR family transcriptional regulator [Microvirga alba]
MTTRLPPLNALRALEAAGRYVSFTRAADELHVTPGAISRQIRGLEDILGFSLFERHHREVKLTAESQVYVEALTDAFNQMERATRRLVDSRKQNYLHIHTAITFTMRWLVPKLVAFHALYPKREIRMSTMMPGAADLSALPTDVSIQIRSPEIVAAAAPALIAHPLMDIDLVPVCSPQLMAECELGRAPSRWQTVTRLISSARPNDWQTWVAASGVDIDPQIGMRVESSSLAYQAAIEGIGVALAMKRLVQEDLKAGRLVIAHPLIYPTGTSFYLLYSQAASQMPQVKEFRDWVVQEAKDKD